MLRFGLTRLGRAKTLTFGNAAAAAAAAFKVLSSAGTLFTTTRTVLSSTGASFPVPQATLSSGGTSYNPI